MIAEVCLQKHEPLSVFLIICLLKLSVLKKRHKPLVGFAGKFSPHIFVYRQGLKPKFGRREVLETGSGRQVLGEPPWVWVWR